jgi:TonB family protein
MPSANGLCLLETSREEYKRRTFAFSAACVVQSGGLGLLVLLCAWFPPHQQAQRITTFDVITLPSFAEQKPLPQPPAPPKVKFRAVQTPQLAVPEVAAMPLPPPPAVKPPEAPPKLPPLDVPKPPAPAPLFARAAPPAPPAPPRAPVHTGLFSETQDHPGSMEAHGGKIATGGFGSPGGIPAQAQGGSAGNLPRLGTFGATAGPGGLATNSKATDSKRIVAEAGFAQGMEYTAAQVDNKSKHPVHEAVFGAQAYSAGGTGDRAGRRAVASAGFANGVAGGVGPGQGAAGAVKTGAFGTAPQAAPAPAQRAEAPPPPKVRPVEILSKPSPEYTEEARQQRVQGDVVLAVIFQADGTLKILRVVQSLGYGLDEKAEQAASQIRFKPAQQEDKPTDFPATLHIQFRIA